MIREIQKDEEKKWDEFVRRHPYGDYTSLVGYANVLSQTCGHKMRFFVHENNGIWKSILPFLESAGRLISHAGILMDSSVGTDEGYKIAYDWYVYTNNLASNESCHALGALYQRDHPERFGEFKRMRQEVAVLSLDRSWDEVEGLFERQIKKAVRRAHEEKVEIVSVSDKKTMLEVFYPLYARWSWRRHGSPAHGKEYFSALHDALSKEIVLYVAYADGLPVGALLGFDTGMRLYAAFNPSDISSNHNRANDLLHYTMIKDAHARKVPIFDFGPIKYEGQERYKEKWGTEKIPADSWYLGKYPGVKRGMSQRIISRVWRTLPFFIAERMGPFIRR